MALVLSSNSDLVYLPDHGFVGEEGALRILVQINRRIRRLDVSHNLLGSEGTLILFKGLTTIRNRYSTPEIGLWGLSEINLGCNAITDSGFEGVLAYAKKDVMMRKLTIQANEIELKDNLDSIIHALNSCRLQTLSLTNNKGITPSSLSTLFSRLDSPYLHELHLSSCDVGPELAGPIIDYLRSPRSRNLEILKLNGNRLGLEAVMKIIDTIETSNFTIEHLQLLANESRPAARVEEDENGNSIAIEPVIETREMKEARWKEERALSLQVTDRLPQLWVRNRTLTSRVKRAASRCLVPARILLNAKPPSATTQAEQAIEGVINGFSNQPFRLLALPKEILFHIVRHTSQDSTAMSDTQFARLRKEVMDKEAFKRNMRTMQARMRSYDQSSREVVLFEIREEWLKKGGWDKWECDVIKPVEVEQKGSEEENDGCEGG